MSAFVTERRNSYAYVFGQDASDIVNLIQRTTYRCPISPHPDLITATNLPIPRFLINQKDVTLANDDKINLKGTPVGGRQHFIADDDPIGGEVRKFTGSTSLTLGRKGSGFDDLRHWILLRRSI